ncbi:ABC transporter [Mycobacterium sp. 852002-51152_SCH6134967]|uniref:GTPase n=1 Tax=Mycobacterium sp. 852002-51152_SCH6134967 TaxID=1834096 RepID=UPI0008023B77|nr:GTPase [Mycobacterium sp. 852002-51152_SCH6134967]OBF88674.1 ABC transporter [Mycobacterium sp. 852002-51152_SCH6134967]
MTLTDRLAALSAITALGDGRLPDELLAELRNLDQRAGTRLRLSGENTVVALAGATGSGKSSLFNAIVGAPLAAVGVRRPTTSATQAVVFGRSGATELLDWLEIGTRQYSDASAAPEWSGLVLLDLPDHDSTELSHRAEVDRLVRLVDAFVWVLDPQKYADAVLHDSYLRPLAAHRDVMAVVLNQSDRLLSSDVDACVRDLHRLLADDGLAGVPVLATSAVTPDGVAPLHDFLAATVANHRARTARVSADLDATAARLAPLIPERRSDPALRDGGRRLQSALAAAAGVPTVVAAVGRAYDRRGLAAVGWPPLRWLAKVRPDPLRRLGISQLDGHDKVLRRTSLPSASAASRAAVDTAVRSLADVASAGLPAPWPRKMLEAAKSRTPDVPDALDRVVGGTNLGLDRAPRWWALVGALQWALLAAAVVGGASLGVIAVLAYLQIDVEAPSLGPFAWPTVLLVGGLALGMALRVIIRPFVAVGAARRRRRAAAELRRRVDAVGEELILAPLRAELAVYEQLSAAVHRLGSR